MKKTVQEKVEIESLNKTETEVIKLEMKNLRSQTKLS